MAPRARGGAGNRRNREQELLDAAITVFHRKGYPAASLQDVANIVGVLKGSLYHYISSKEELLARICVASHAQATALMDRTVQLPGTPLQRLEHYLGELALWYLHNIPRVSIYFNESRWLTGERRDTVRTQARDFAAFVRTLIEDCRAAGHLRTDVDPRVAAQLIIGSLNSVSQWYRPDGLYSPEEIATAYTGLSLAAVTGPPPRSATGPAIAAS